MDSLVWQIIAAAIAAIPLYFALHLVGAKKAGLIRVMLVNVLVGAIVSGIHSYFGFWAGVISFIAVIFIYKEMFELGWVSSIIAWVLETVVVALILFAFIAFLGAIILL